MAVLQDSERLKERVEMTTAQLNLSLPTCHFIDALHEKLASRHDLQFDPLHKLDEFRDHVSQEVRYINVLFPEHTPHDEDYHLKRLFNVADTVLGHDLIDNMLGIELYVLAVALYGHDWGMAVSEAQKDWITRGVLPAGQQADDLWLLPNERDLFAKFACEHGVAVDNEGRIQGDLPIELWRAFIRDTHAERSGERVRRYFEAIDGGVSDAASRICESHTQDIETLENHDLYPTDYPVLRESLNLRALAVYLRLVDLLDLAEDRTPYVLWKFVAPRDPRSRMEWDKHRALRPVTCPDYQDGRCIRVEGRTKDHEVFAALEDLRIYCEKQFRQSRAVLARMNDPRHRLNLYDINWRVVPSGFEPVSIRFEFDRERMFDILSNEIYQGDPYVFLRELLQNSIDAIRLRRQVLKQQGPARGRGSA